MGSFGTAVTSLLDTYTKCLSLLKSHRGDEDNGGDDTSSDSLQSLGSSLRSDQARVRQAYSSHLLRNGAQFEKGDVASQSALNRIVKRLTAALNKVAQSFGSRQPPPVVDYNSLLALSHGTSLDAIRTIEDLSHRAHSGESFGRSRRSVESKSKKQARRHSRHRQPDGKSKKPKAVKSPKAKTRRGKSRSGNSTSQSSTRPSNRRRQRVSRNKPPKKAPAAENRVSLVTIASDSTKLGEIRRRESRQGLRIPNAAYPLYMYPPDEGKKRKKWWDLFGSE